MREIPLERKSGTVCWLSVHAEEIGDVGVPVENLLLILSEGFPDNQRIRHRTFVASGRRSEFFRREFAKPVRTKCLGEIGLPPFAGLWEDSVGVSSEALQLGIQQVQDLLVWEGGERDPDR